LETLAGIVDLARQGLLLKYAVASLFRVTWGFIAAAVLAIPMGLTIGWYRRAEMAFNPLIQGGGSGGGVSDFCKLLLPTAADGH
jgi:NitT/TauT family transport system permease protein